MARGKAKLLGVPIVNPRFAEVGDLCDLPHHWLVEVENFFETYKVLEGKPVLAEGWKGADEANDMLNKPWSTKAALLEAERE